MFGEGGENALNECEVGQALLFPRNGLPRKHIGLADFVAQWLFVIFDKNVKS